MKKSVKNYFAKEILSYLSSSDEKLLYVGKPAGITLLPKIGLLSLVLAVGYGLLHTITLIYLENTLSFIIGLLVLISFSLILSSYVLLDWLFDFYIVTNKKIIDVRYAPPFSHNLITILLDQVRCTEVDTQKNGLLHELLNIGNVTVTFDRPTHQEAFTFYDINRPEEVSLFLGQALTAKDKETMTPFWYRIKPDGHRLLMGEDITPPVIGIKAAHI